MLLKIYFSYLFIVALLLSFGLFYVKNHFESFKNRKNDSQIDMFTYSNFDPLCCPSPYTTSSGCLCYDFDEDLEIITRGGNRHYTHNDAYINSVSLHHDKRQDKTRDDHLHNICEITNRPI